MYTVLFSYIVTHIHYIALLCGVKESCSCHTGDAVLRKGDTGVP